MYKNLPLLLIVCLGFVFMSATGVSPSKEVDAKLNRTERVTKKIEKKLKKIAEKSAEKRSSTASKVWSIIGHSFLLASTIISLSAGFSFFTAGLAVIAAICYLVSLLVSPKKNSKE